MVTPPELIQSNGVTYNPKRIVILCDGTWQSADKNPASENYPTNIVRLARSIKQVTWIDKMNEKGEKVPTQVKQQIALYQSGVGTGLGDLLCGGAIGLGLSEKIRTVYGFLANNYVDGDTIALFGFSRGAFTARAIAGLITEMGLLTKRGMDNFADVYSNYYGERKEVRREEYGLKQLPPGTIEVIGVFDTVGFHRPIISWLPSSLRERSLVRRFIGEQYELKNTKLPKGIKYAFHALSLDEAKYTFKPTLWFQHKDDEGQSEATNGVWDGKTLLEQVWFSGKHSDIGGGSYNQELSDIAFGWMASQLKKHNLLDLDHDYLLENPDRGDDEDGNKWATKQRSFAPRTRIGRRLLAAKTRIGQRFIGGKLSKIIQDIVSVVYIFAYWLLAILTVNIFTTKIDNIWGVRTPGRYTARDVDSICKPEHFVTNEALHRSIKDRGHERKFSRFSWPCIALRGWTRGPDQEKEWTSPEVLNNGNSTMSLAGLGPLERLYKNNLRNIYEERTITTPRPASQSQSVKHVEKTARDANGTAINGF